MNSKIFVSFRDNQTHIASKKLSEATGNSYVERSERRELEQRFTSALISSGENHGRRKSANPWEEYLELSYPAGQLVFACLDIDWAELYRQIDELLTAFADCRIPIDPEMLQKLDWDGVHALAEEKRRQQAAREAEWQAEWAEQQKRGRRKSTAQWNVFKKMFSHTQDQTVEPEHAASQAQAEAPALETVRTILEGLTDPENALYCRAASFYRTLCAALRDYPAMKDLVELYCLQVFGTYYADALDKLSLAKITQEQRELLVELNDEVPIAFETQKVSTMCTCAVIFRQLLQGSDEVGSPIHQFADNNDAYLSAVAWEFLDLLNRHLQQLAEFQPYLQNMVANTILDPPPCDENATPMEEHRPDLRYFEISYGNGSGYRYGAAARRTLTPEVLVALATPTTKGRNKHPDIVSTMYLSGDNFVGFVMLEWEQLCMQRTSVRACEHCGKLYVPFGKMSKYCDRIAPGETTLTCKEAAKKLQESKRLEKEPWTKQYYQLNNTFNGRLRRAGYELSRQRKIMDDWHTAATAKMAQMMAEDPTFDKERFVAEMEMLFTDIKTQEARSHRTNIK